MYSTITYLQFSAKNLPSLYMKTRKRFPKKRQKKRKTLGKSRKHKKNRQRTKKKHGYGRGAMLSMMANDDYDEEWDTNIPLPPLPPPPPAPPPPPLPPLVDPPLRFYFYRGRSRKRR